MNSAENLYRAIVAYINESIAETERRVLEQVRAQGGLIPDRTMDAQQAADYLGICKKTLYIMIAEKQIKHIPAGSIRSKRPAYLFRQSVLDAWMREREEASCKS